MDAINQSITKQQLELSSEKAKSEDRVKLALQAEAIYMDVQRDVELLNGEMKNILSQIKQLNHEADSIEDQLESMRKGRGLCF